MTRDPTEKNHYSLKACDTFLKDFESVNSLTEQIRK